MKVAILYNQFFSRDGSTRRIGGIETYLEYLSLLCLKLGHTPVIFQLADKPFEKDCRGFRVFGYPGKNVSELYERVLEQTDPTQDLILFGGDQFSVKMPENSRAIALQHGISWDKPYLEGRKTVNFLKRLRMIRIAIRDFNHCPYRVCVDYNFYNWYKTLTPNSIPSNLWIVPNFAEKIASQRQLDDKLSRVQRPIRIIFARRFYDFRGAVLFSRVMDRILSRYPETTVTLAGEGPCETEMRRILAGYPDRVQFIKYLPQDSFDVHYRHDIAVVPTLGSEGTSLSLLEAMAAGCLAVTTPIGGMSNIILDGYNGLFSMPDEDSLAHAMERAIEALPDGTLQRQAVDTVRCCFSLSRWESRWTEILKNFEI